MEQPIELSDVVEELCKLRDADQEQMEAMQQRINALEAAQAWRWWHRPARWLRWIGGAPG